MQEITSPQTIVQLSNPNDIQAQKNRQRLVAAWILSELYRVNLLEAGLRNLLKQRMQSESENEEDTIDSFFDVLDQEKTTAAETPETTLLEQLLATLEGVTISTLETAQKETLERLREAKERGEVTLETANFVKDEIIPDVFSKEHLHNAAYCVINHQDLPSHDEISKLPEAFHADVHTAHRHCQKSRSTGTGTEVTHRVQARYHLDTLMVVAKIAGQSPKQEVHQEIRNTFFNLVFPSSTTLINQWIQHINQSQDNTNINLLEHAGFFSPRLGPSTTAACGPTLLLHEETVITFTSQ